MDTRIVLAAIVGAACAAAGAGVVTVLRAETVATPAQRESAAAPQPVAADGLQQLELDALVEELRRLREELASRREAVGNGEPAPASDSLQAQLTELRALVERRAALAPAPELDLSSKGPRRAELFVRSTDPEPEVDDSEKLAKRYCLWSPQRVLDEFGMPDRVSTNDGAMRWIYSENDDALATVLDFAAGYLVNVWVADD
ncbi:MAG: hypothetical protein JNN27_18375 [Planctomycetes bacterium]|nr:hypothetical protein [Planctomycetota bacterium]